MRDKDSFALTSFVLSIIPPSALFIFALYLAMVNIGVNFTGNGFAILALILFMILLGIMLYIGTYVISISALILGIRGLNRGLEGKQKRFALAGVIISMFNFSIPFLVSHVNELFLR